MAEKKEEVKEEVQETKRWFLSKTVITSAAAFLVAVGTAAGLIDTDSGLKVEALLVPLIFTFLRIGDKPLSK